MVRELCLSLWKKGCPVEPREEPWGTDYIHNGWSIHQVVDGHFFGSRVAPCAVAAMIDVVNLSDQLLSWTLVRSRFQARIIMPPTLLSTTQLAPFFRACACKENTCKLFINQSSGNGLRKVCLKHFQPLPDDWWINITTLLYQCFQQISTMYLVYAKHYQPII